MARGICVYVQKDMDKLRRLYAWVQCFVDIPRHRFPFRLMIRKDFFT